MLKSHFQTKKKHGNNSENEKRIGIKTFETFVKFETFVTFETFVSFKTFVTFERFETFETI